MQQRVKITMTATRDGADDGFTVRTYQKGETYEVSRDLAHDFIAGKYATHAPAIAATRQPRNRQQQGGADDDNEKDAGEKPEKK